MIETADIMTAVEVTSNASKRNITFRAYGVTITSTPRSFCVILRILMKG